MTVLLDGIPSLYPPPFPIIHPIRFLCWLFLRGRHSCCPYLMVVITPGVGCGIPSYISNHSFFPFFPTSPLISGVALIYSCAPFRPASCSSVLHTSLPIGNNSRRDNQRKKRCVPFPPSIRQRRRTNITALAKFHLPPACLTCAPSTMVPP